MSEDIPPFIVSIFCVAVFIAAVIGIIRLRQRVSRLPATPSARPATHRREVDDDGDGGDGDDGGDGGDA